MATKQELSDQINERLKTDIDWSEMKKDDLEKFRDGLQDEQFIKKVVGQYANDVGGDKIQERVEGWQPGMFIQMFAKMQEGDMNMGDAMMRM